MNLENLLTPSVLFLITIVVWFAVERLLSKHMSKDDLAKIKQLSDIAVSAAEQMMKVGKIPPEERYSYAFNVLQDELNKHGIKVDLSFLVVLIEAAVGDMNSKK